MYYQYATEEDALNDNWSDPVVIDYGHWTSNATTPTDCGYPSLWKDAANNLHCVFYDGDGSGTAYGANWRLIDGNPYVQSKPVSDNGSGSLAIAYSQKQVEFMLEEQRKSIMSVMMVYINDLYDKAGSLVPDSGENDGSNYITSNLLLSFNFIDTSLWDETSEYIKAEYSTNGEMYAFRAVASAFAVENSIPALKTSGTHITLDNTKRQPAYSSQNRIPDMTIAEMGVNSEEGFAIEVCGFVYATSFTPYMLWIGSSAASWPSYRTVVYAENGALVQANAPNSVALNAGDVIDLVYVYTPTGITVYCNGSSLGTVEIDTTKYNETKNLLMVQIGNNSNPTISRLYNAPLTADQCMNNYKWFVNFVDTYTET